MPTNDLKDMMTMARQRAPELATIFPNVSENDITFFLVEIMRQMFQSPIIRDQVAANAPEYVAQSPDFVKGLGIAIVDSVLRVQTMTHHVLNNPEKLSAFGQIVSDLMNEE